MLALCTCMASYQELSEVLCSESLVLGRKNELGSNNDNRIQWGRCNSHFFNWSWPATPALLGRMWCRRIFSEVHFDTQADLQLKQDIFFFLKVIFTLYLNEVSTSKHLSMRISTLERDFLVIYKTSEYICALLAYCQETWVVLSSMQICIGGKPVGARE